MRSERSCSRCSKPRSSPRPRVDAGSSHLARLGAASRPAGSRAADEARAYCAGVLRGIGFSIEERSFEYSKIAGAFAAPAAGLCVAAFAVAIFALRPLDAASLSAMAVVAGLVALFFQFVAGRGVLGLPFARAIFGAVRHRFAGMRYARRNTHR